jgi:hypothetical protein
MNKIVDFSLLDVKKGEISRVDLLYDIKDCKPFGFLPFKGDNDPRSAESKDIVKEKLEEYIPEEISAETGFLPQLVRECLQVTVSQDLLRLQAITIGFFLKDEIVVVEGPVRMLCSRSKTRTILTNYILRNAARIIEDVVNKYSEVVKFRVCHMRVSDVTHNTVTSASTFTTRRIWTSERFENSFTSTLYHYSFSMQSYQFCIPTYDMITRWILVVFSLVTRGHPPIIPLIKHHCLKHYQD